MARRPYVFLAGDLSGWPLGMTPTPAFLRNLDQHSSELVNGEEGGEWEPEDPIVLGGRGGSLNDADEIMEIGDDSVLSGDIETLAGNSRGQVVNQVPEGLNLLSTAYPAFQSARTRTVVVGFTNAVDYDANAATNLPRYMVDPTTLGIKSVTTVSSTRTVAVPLPMSAQHRGATITNIALRFVIAGKHSSLPSTMLGFRVARISAVADTAAGLHTNGAPYDSNGYYVDDAATVADFMNQGRIRTLNYVPDQNNVVDPDTYWYVLQARSHSNNVPASPQGGIGLIFVSATITLSSITSFREK